MRTVKSGVIGLGFVGPIHVEALRRTGLADVVAVAHSNIEHAEHMAGVLNVPKAYGDYRLLLADTSIEAIHICTPNNSHYEIAKGAMLAGKHVICEKPISMDMDEARDLIEIASRTGIVNAVNFNLRYYPMLHMARDMIHNGSIGEIFAVNASYTQDWMLYDSDYNWRVEPELSGSSRVIGDIGSHCFDALEFLTGSYVEQLCANIAIFHRTRKKPLKASHTFNDNGDNPPDSETERVGIRTEDYAGAVFRMDNGAHGTIMLTQCMAGRKNSLRIEILGSKKSLEFDSERPNELRIGNRDKANEILLKDPALLTLSAKEITSYPAGHNEGYCDTMKHLFGKIYSYILEGKDRIKESISFPLFEDGLRAMSICNAMLRSQKHMGWIDL